MRSLSSLIIEAESEMCIIPNSLCCFHLCVFQYHVPFKVCISNSHVTHTITVAMALQTRSSACLWLLSINLVAACKLWLILIMALFANLI